MQCKSCNQEISSQASYCSHCGAPVVSDRITTKRMIKSFSQDYLGLDNKYLLTLKTLLFRPEKLLKEYLNGTRKKYVAPIAFLAINTAISMFIFSQFSEKYVELSSEVNERQFDFFEKQYKDAEKLQEFREGRVEDLERGKDAQRTILKYFNIFTFLLIPVYALMSFLVFWKPYNYGEHMLITCYVQGFLFLASMLLFVFSLLINPLLYFLSVPTTIIYYLYSYGRLYKLSFPRLLLRLLKFFGLLLLFAIVLIVVGILVSYISKTLNII